MDFCPRWRVNHDKTLPYLPPSIPPPNHIFFLLVDCGRLGVPLPLPHHGIPVTSRLSAPNTLGGGITEHTLLSPSCGLPGLLAPLRQFIEASLHGHSFWNSNCHLISLQALYISLTSPTHTLSVRLASSVLSCTHLQCGQCQTDNLYQ